MKKYFLNLAMSSIKKSHPEYDDEKLAEYKYGLEGFYLLVSKSIIIFSIAFILNIFKEIFLLFIIFNSLRITGYGLHASKTWICLLGSLIIFIGIPIISKIIIIPLYIEIIIGIIYIILLYRYAPADTEKRPLVNENRRKKYKFITTMVGIILVFLNLIITDFVISNLIIFGMSIEIFMILPISYKLFNFTYNNYLAYE